MTSLVYYSRNSSYCLALGAGAEKSPVPMVATECGGSPFATILTLFIYRDIYLLDF